MKKLYVSDSENKGDRYTWNDKPGSVHRAPVDLIDPAPTKVGEADNLRDAVDLAKSHHGSGEQKVKVK